MRILVIDNYDSFTYNLVHALRNLTSASVDVFRNDKIDLDEINSYQKIVLSPGPGIPDEAGIMKQLIDIYTPTKSILGVCLGHQAIAEVFGARLYNLTSVFHGIATDVEIVDPRERLFDELPSKFTAGRYHSWTVDPKSIPNELQVTAIDPDGQIMALSHKRYDVRGVQFHPESILTPLGEWILHNWLNLETKEHE